MEKKVYTKKSEKVIDFFIGFLGMPLLAVIALNFPMLLFRKLKILYIIYPLLSIIALLLVIVVIGVAIFLSIKRKYIRIGLLFAVVTTFLLVGGCFLLLYMALSH